MVSLFSCLRRQFLIWRRLQEETAKVEEHLLKERVDGLSFTDAIVRCLALSKANAFENILEPLQKLLRLSPPIAATFARSDLFSRIGQKLHHNKAAVRLNLLRILSSICDAAEEQGDLLAQCGLLDAIRELENDPAVLVRDMAGKLVKQFEENEHLTGARRRTLMRRTSISTMSHQSLGQNLSRPTTPQVGRPGQSRGFFDVRDAPSRHSRNGGLGGPASHLRPPSRDGNSSALGAAGGNGGGGAGAAAGRSRVSRSNRLSLMGSIPPPDDARPTTPSSSRSPSAVNPPRRRRMTNSDLEWS